LHIFLEKKTSKECTVSAGMLLARIVDIPVPGIRSKKEDALSTKKYATPENLQKAYAAEARHHRWYTRLIE
jgi:hypothetical protein